MVSVSSLVNEVELRLFYFNEPVEISSKDWSLIDQAYSFLGKKYKVNERKDNGNYCLEVKNA